MTADKKLSEYNAFGVQRRNPLNFFGTFGLAFLYVLVVALFVFNYLTVTRVAVLENEVENLKQTLSGVRLLDDNLIRDIIGFDDDDEDTDAFDTDQEPRIVIPEGSISEYVDYENYDEKHNETNREEDRYTKFLNRLSKVGDENREFETTTPQTEDANESIREKRSIVAATDDGVVINSESYAEKKAKVTSGYNLRGKVTQMPTRASTRGTPWPVYPYKYSTAAYYRHRPTKPTKAPNVYIRSSRVKHFDNKSKASKQNVKLANLKSLDSYLDSNEDTTTYAPPITIVRNTGYRRRSIKHLPSVHYSGDTSRYTLGVHDNFYGNDQLRHLNETFVDWKATEWVETLKMHTHFTIDNGHVTVKQTGLYFVYAQIYYMDAHDRVGYKVIKNDRVILECAITSPSIGGGMKSNTCYTAGVEHFRAGDRLELRDIEQRLSLFASGKSFFGLVKLGNISI